MKNIKQTLKKITSIICIFSFLLYITSCYSYTRLATTKEIKEYVTSYERVSALQAVTNAEDTLTFHRNEPGEITVDYLTGRPQFRISFGAADSLVLRGNTVDYFWKDGARYYVIEQDSAGFIFTGEDFVKIPVSDIKYLDVRRSNTAKAVGIVIIISLFVGIAIYGGTHFTIYSGI